MSTIAGATPEVKKDSITLQRIKQLHPNVRSEALEIYDEICKSVNGRVLCRFSHTHRTFAEQNALYAQGRTKPGSIVTHAIGGQSYHNYGFAIDVVLIIDKDGNGTHETASWDRSIDVDSDGKSDWQEIVSIFKMYGWEWGGDWKFKDYPHFQKTIGKSIANLKSLYFSGRVDKNNYVII